MTQGDESQCLSDTEFAQEQERIKRLQAQRLVEHIKN